ncbi:MAG: hypothetical protein ACK4N5_17870, partial [Myxococcales bacterium]
MTKSLNSLDIMRVAFQTYAQRAGTVLTVSLAINLTCLVATVLAMNAFGMWGFIAYLALSQFAAQLTTGASSLLVSGIWTKGDVPESMDLIKAVLARGGALFALSILYGLGVGFFLIFLIIPGIYVAIKWSLAAPALLIRQVGVSDAFKTSSELTKQAMGPTFAVVLFTFVFNLLVPQLLSGGSGGSMAPLETQVITTFVISTFAAPVAGLAYGELYLRLATVIPPPVPFTPAPTGPWIGVPQPVHGMHRAPAATGGYAGGFGAPAATAYQAPAQPYGAPAPQAPQAPQPYGAPAPQAPQAYGAPAPQAYGAPAPAQQPYGAPAPQAYGAPAPAQQPYGAPAPQTYSAPVPAQQPYGAPAPQAYGTTAPA